MKLAQRTAVAVIAAAALVAAGSQAAVAAPARKAPPPILSIGSGNGVAGFGVPTVVVGTRLAGQTVAFQASGPGGVVTSNVALDSSGLGFTDWVPNAPGIWTVSGLGALASAPAYSISVGAMPTTTVITSPTSVGINTITPLPVQVSAPRGSAPTGRVSLVTAGGSTVSTATLQPTAQEGVATATLIWAPDSLGTWPMTAVYTPATSVMSPSSSRQIQVQVQSSASTVALAYSSALRAGQPTQVTAVITPGTTTGSAAFQLNNSSLSGSIGTSLNTTYGTPMSTVTAPWTPTFAGSQLLTAQFTSSDGQLTEQVSQAVNVLPAAVPDQVTLSVSPQIAVGASVPYGLSNLSGAPTLITAVGDTCAIRGSFIVGLRKGQCRLGTGSMGSPSYTVGGSVTTITIG